MLLHLTLQTQTNQIKFKEQKTINILPNLDRTQSEKGKLFFILAKDGRRKKYENIKIQITCHYRKRRG